MAQRAKLAIGFLLVFAAAANADDVFVRGDANADGIVSVADAALIAAFRFTGDPGPMCGDAADYDDNGLIDTDDAVFILLSLSGERIREPVPPFPRAGDDPTVDALGCESYQPALPRETSEVLRIEDVEAAPGHTVRVPVVLTSTEPTDAFHLIVGYDPERFLVEAGRPDVATFVDLSAFDPPVREHFDSSFFDMDGSADGLLRLTFVAQLLSFEKSIPSGERQLIGAVVGRVSRLAEPGDVIDLDFDEFAGVFGKARNELSRQGRARFPSTAGGSIRVARPFLRGDGDGDGVVGVTDAVMVLAALFQGTGPLACADAGDANDDGRLDITDAVAILGHLFRGDPELPPPFPEPGADPTADTLEVCGG